MSEHPERLSKPFPHLHRGRSGLHFLLAAYNSGLKRGLVGMVVIGAVCGGVGLVSSTVGMVCLGVLGVPLVAGVVWNQRYAARLRSAARRTTVRRGAVTAVVEVSYTPQGKLYGRPVLNAKRNLGGFRDPAFASTCVAIDDQFFILRGTEHLASWQPGQQVEFESVPELALLLRIDDLEIEDGMWCHLFHRKGLAADVQSALH